MRSILRRDGSPRAAWSPENGRPRMSFSRPHLSLNTAVMTRPCVLAIGFQPEDLPQWPGQTPTAEMRFVPLHQLGDNLADAAGVDCVVCPLVTARFDALEVAAELSRARFHGTLVLVMPRVPRPQIIVRELKQICPGLSVELVHKAPH